MQKERPFRELISNGLNFYVFLDSLSNFYNERKQSLNAIFFELKDKPIQNG